jgi:hypothetical protein
MKNNLSYFLLGDMSTKKIIGTYEPTHMSYDILEKARNIFNSVKTFEKKGKVSHNSNLYYSAIRNNIFLLAVVPNDSDEKILYEFFEEVDNQQIWKYVDKTNELSNVGKQNLIFLINKYQKTDKLAETVSEINEVKLEMQSGMKKMLHNFEMVKDLDNKAEKIKDSSVLFKRDATQLNRNLWWRDMKIKIFLGSFLLSIIIYAIYRILN